MNYLLLGCAIIAEVIGTSFMKQSDGFTRLVPSLVTAVAYLVAFYCLSLTLRTIPTGIAYAIWSGVGIVLIAAVAWLVQGQR
ncbi:multidrug efflux SMR transporter, partial [Klebsiella pneumoniae]|nr:multidrug efflux SMR transporter [Klebsiella pneumoniae]